MAKTGLVIDQHGTVIDPSDGSPVYRCKACSDSGRINERKATDNGASAAIEFVTRYCDQCDAGKSAEADDCKTGLACPKCGHAVRVMSDGSKQCDAGHDFDITMREHVFEGVKPGTDLISAPKKTLCLFRRDIQCPNPAQCQYIERCRHADH